MVCTAYFAPLPSPGATWLSWSQKVILAVKVGGSTPGEVVWGIFPGHLESVVWYLLSY